MSQKSAVAKATEPTPRRRVAHRKSAAEIVTATTLEHITQEQITQEQIGQEQVAREDIARLAYALWEERGMPEGTSEEDWFCAEQQLTTGGR